MREPEACRHRRAADDDNGVACGLVLELTGLADRAAARVGPDACQACCRGPEPSPGRINPVVASVLSRAAARVIDAGGEPGCTVAKADFLLNWARGQLGVAFPEEEGDGPTPPAWVRGPCLDLGEAIEPDAGPRFWCRHPSHTTTTPDGCQRCRDWSDRPRPAPRPLVELLPLPAVRCGPPVRNWAVGVRTAPRRAATHDHSIDSLIRAGWTEPRVFADTPVALAPRSDRLPLTVRSGKVGAWPNFYLALAELLMREPYADAYLLAEDDVLYYDRQDLKGYLEQALWPGDAPGLVSLYCPTNYSRPGSGWHRREGRWTLGALAFIFPQALARRFMTDPMVLDHRLTGPAEGLAGVSEAVGSWAARNDVPVYYPCPSLAQHIGDRSTLWPANRSVPHRRADRFLGDLDGP